jgi:hypothetical protein
VCKTTLNSDVAEDEKEKRRRLWEGGGKIGGEAEGSADCQQ